MRKRKRKGKLNIESNKIKKLWLQL
jgi:hypothetical protein